LLQFDSFNRVWFLTWTTYGTWLPGDERGFVSPKFEGDEPERRNNVLHSPYDAGRPELRSLALAKLVGDPVFFDEGKAVVLQGQFEETAAHRGWVIVIGAVMTSHVHLVVGVSGDPEPSVLMRDFKSYGSRALNRRYAKPESGTWWTEQGSKRKVKNQQHFEAVVNYVLKQEKPLVVWGELRKQLREARGADAKRTQGGDA
jgi:REP element-mobilizing transposase RayT